MHLLLFPTSYWAGGWEVSTRCESGTKSVSISLVNEWNCFTQLVSGLKQSVKQAAISNKVTNTPQSFSMTGSHIEPLHNEGTSKT